MWKFGHRLSEEPRQFEFGESALQWLCFGLIEAELPAVCIETRHAKAAVGAMATNKNATASSAIPSLVSPLGGA